MSFKDRQTHRHMPSYPLTEGQNCYVLFNATFVLLAVFIKDKYFKYFRTNCDQKNLIHFFQIMLWNILQKSIYTK